MELLVVCVVISIVTVSLLPFSLSRKEVTSQGLDLSRAHPEVRLNGNRSTALMCPNSSYRKNVSSI